MSRFLIPIIFVIIIVALSSSIVSGVLIVTSDYKSVELPLPENLDLDLFFKLNSIKITEDKKNQLSNHFEDEDIDETIIRFEPSQFVYTVKEPIQFRGKIINSISTEDIIINLYAIETWKPIDEIVMPKLSQDGIIMGGLGLQPAGVYEMVISHNGVNASKTIIVKNLDPFDIFNIITSDSISIPSKKIFGSFAHCPSGKHAIGGGVQIIQGKLIILNSQPTGNKDLEEFSSWTADVLNQGEENGIYQVYVKCKSSN